MRGLLLLLALVSACTRVPEYVTYDADTLTGFGPPGSPPDKVPIVRDASTRFPPMVSKCGGANLREIPATDGVTIFRIDIPKAQEAKVVDCLKTHLQGVQAFEKVPSQ